MPAATVRRTPRAKTDAVLSGAVELARHAAEEEAESPSHVGEHEGSTVVGDRLVEHRFTATMPGYRGWHWTVTLARVPRGRTATVCEVELLPGPDSILAPEWLPWSERLRPEDIGPGDVVPFNADDPRLEPGFTPTGDEEIDAVAIDELALARVRVVSAFGISDAAQRWTEQAAKRGAPGQGLREDCATCAYLVPLQGSLGRLFGVCVNPWSPFDGKVVSLEYGCGAHPEPGETHRSDWPDNAPIVDELGIEVVRLPVPADELPAPADESVETPSDDPAPAEPVETTPADD